MSKNEEMGCSTFNVRADNMGSRCAFLGAVSKNTRNISKIGEGKPVRAGSGNPGVPKYEKFCEWPFMNEGPPPAWGVGGVEARS